VTWHKVAARLADRFRRRAGRPVRCPTLVAWSIHDELEQLWGDPVAIWRAWADDVRGARIDSGHHMAEEAPEQLAAVLGGFFSACARAS
jgi:haloacetate dehalogenase